MHDIDASVGPSYTTLMAILRSRVTYVVMIGLGLLLGAWWVVEDQSLRDAPQRFHQVPCVIRGSSVETFGRYTNGVPCSFAPVIQFTFTAENGQEHTVAGYRLREDGMSMLQADDIADRYEPGQQTTCYYDPADPTKAVLSLDVDRQQIAWLFLVSLVLAPGGLAGLLFLEYVVKPAERPPQLTPEIVSAALEPPPTVGAARPDALQAEPPAASWEEAYCKQVGRDSD